jgi:hypothetical protein
MKTRLLLVLFMAWLALAGCGSVYDDSGAAEPASWWPWVCPDGGLAPDSGCLPSPTGPGDGGAEGG